jgi:hypothetical protein
VRDIYLKYVRSGELNLIDGNKPKAIVAQEVFSVVEAFLETHS